GPELSGAVAYNNALYYIADVPQQGLYRSDGTAGGNTPVKALPPGSGGIGGDHDFTVAHGMLFPPDHRAVWKSDGTGGGTAIVKDNVVGNYTPYPTNELLPDSFPVINGSVYFVNTPDTPGASPALWKTDGTAAGTVEVDLGLSVPGGRTLEDISDLTAINGEL